MFRIFLNTNSISYSFRSIANQNGVRYSDSTSYFKKYSGSKCKRTVCLHYGLDFPFKKFNTIGNARWWAKAGAIQKIFGKYDDGEASCKQFLIRICYGFVVKNCKHSFSRKETTFR